NVLARDVFAGSGESIEPGTDDDPAPPVRDASLSDLLEALRDVLGRLKPPRAHEGPREGLSVRECVERILAQFALGDEVNFGDLFTPAAHRSEVIVTFLALLELIRLRVLCARQLDRFGPITLGLVVASFEEAALRVRDLGSLDEWRGGEEHHGDGSAADK